jgi:UDP-2,3-diacylglucosamine pyrophosphatase LpxH
MRCNRTTRLSIGSVLGLVIMFAVSVSSSAQQPDQFGRYLYFIGDLHMGAGFVQGHQPPYRNIEDFRWNTEFQLFLDHIDEESHGNADLVFLGDSFELWQSPFLSCNGQGVSFHCSIPDCVTEGVDRGCTEAEAVKRLEYVLDQHEDTIKAISKFAELHRNHIVFVPGNHDAVLLMPKVRELLLGKLDARTRVDFSSNGYWISQDKRIYADHGHMFDKVNSFSKWPKPFQSTASGLIMERPWGEQMVQQFFNQYEELLPAIDNVSPESAGVSTAIDTLGDELSIQAAGRFLKLLAFDTSIGQKIAFLGKPEPIDGDSENLGDNAATDVQWDVKKIRKVDPGQFLLESMPSDNIPGKLRKAVEQRVIPTGAHAITDSDIAQLCEQREVLIAYDTMLGRTSSIHECPRRQGAKKLGYVIDKLLGRDLSLRRTYLKRVSSHLRTQFDVYVYAHTHSAMTSTSQHIQGSWNVSVINTGAFQRIASIEDIKRGAALKQQSVPTYFKSLQPEDLPACYSYVRISPYHREDTPVADLLWWTKPNGSWHQADSCDASP